MSFNGLLVCDQNTCPANTDFSHEVIRLNCGHSFHRGCLFDQQEDGGHSYAMTGPVNAQCYESLQQHMEKLATTLNR